MDKSWKAFERRVAEYFGVTRTPLSGRTSRHTASDTLHPRLFVDAKLRRECRTIHRLFKALVSLAKEEGKIPVLVVKPPQAKGALIVCRMKDFKTIQQEIRNSLSRL